MNETIIFPVITLYQPWLAYVIMGYKRIETRTHARFKSLEGKGILIHAAQNVDENLSAWDNKYVIDNYGEKALNEAHKLTDIKGAIVGSAYVEKFAILDDSHSAAACIDCGGTLRWGLFLTQITMLVKPEYVQGSIGIWYYDVTNQQKVRKPILV